jgi:hypothetical protein
MSALGLYLSAFLPKWWALVSGAALFGVERFADRFSPSLKKQLDRIPTGVRRFLEVSFFLIAFFYVGFSVWNDERTTYMAEKCKIEKFEKRSTARNQLATFMMEAQQLASVSSLTKDSPQENVKAWFSSETSWETRLFTWTRDNLGEAAATKIVDTMNMPSGAWSNQTSPEHNQKLSVIAKIEHNIGDLMESSAWDDFDVRVAKSIDACTVNT